MGLAGGSHHGRTVAPFNLLEGATSGSLQLEKGSHQVAPSSQITGATPKMGNGSLQSIKGSHYLKLSMRRLTK